jgi:hypothetical protein
MKPDDPLLGIFETIMAPPLKRCIGLMAYFATLMSWISERMDRKRTSYNSVSRRSSKNRTSDFLRLELPSSPLHRPVLHLQKRTCSQVGR